MEDHLHLVERGQLVARLDLERALLGVDLEQRLDQVRLHAHRREGVHGIRPS
jgi:hypothetical protein